MQTLIGLRDCKYDNNVDVHSYYALVVKRCHIL